MNKKPLNGKSYGSIPHLPNSKMGPADHHCEVHMEEIATITCRKHDRVYVQEKLDGTNVSVANIDGNLVALTRAGYMAKDSPFKQHYEFHDWVELNKSRFGAVLAPGERLAGEWLVQAHGTEYILPHEPFVAFDVITAGMKRATFEEFLTKVGWHFTTPFLVSIGQAISVKKAMSILGPFGKHGALDPIEGAIWRVETNTLLNNHSSEREWRVNFLVKYVRPDKVDGKYLVLGPKEDEATREVTVRNTYKGM
jgi:RNA ligase